jgi:hypothetical protein
MLSGKNRLQWDGYQKIKKGRKVLGPVNGGKKTGDRWAWGAVLKTSPENQKIRFLL